MAGALRGMVNAWKCEACGKITAAVHVDEGVTPMFLACRRTDGCKGTAISSGYPAGPIPKHVLDVVEWEWFVPVRSEIKKLDPGMRGHVENGGAVIRPITDEGRSLLRLAFNPEP